MLSILSVNNSSARVRPRFTAATGLPASAAEGGGKLRRLSCASLAGLFQLEPESPLAVDADDQLAVRPTRHAHEGNAFLAGSFQATHPRRALLKVERPCPAQVPVHWLRGTRRTDDHFLNSAMFFHGGRKRRPAIGRVVLIGTEVRELRNTGRARVSF